MNAPSEPQTPMIRAELVQLAANLEAEVGQFVEERILAMAPRLHCDPASARTIGEIAGTSARANLIEVMDGLVTLELPPILVAEMTVVADAEGETP